MQTPHRLAGGRSLADTEATEDAIQNVVRVHGADHLAQFVQRFAQFERHQFIPGPLRGQSPCGVQAGAGRLQALATPQGGGGHCRAGRPRVFMPFLGGLGAYGEIIGKVAADGYPGFEFTAS